MKIMRFLEGFLLGGLIGATVALLLSPMSGEELRNKMQAETERIKNEVNTAATQRRLEMEKQLAALRAPRTTGTPSV